VKTAITPATKGQLTKLRKMHAGNPQNTFLAIRHQFNRTMPREQAKHATRNYLAAVQQ
jgi:hypothetical protein